MRSCCNLTGRYLFLICTIGPIASLQVDRSQRLEVIRGAAGPQILKGLLSAVHFLHQNEIFYRDLSPQSIQVADGHPKSTSIAYNMLYWSFSKAWKPSRGHPRAVISHVQT